jgi:lysophospholipase L1-like esterase
MVSYGDTAFPYSPYENGYPYLKSIVSENTANIANLKVATRGVRGSKIYGWNDLTNIFNAYVDTSGIVRNSDYCSLSDYIEIQAGEVITYSGLNCNLGSIVMMAISYYDGNKNFISGAGVSASTDNVTGSYTVPNGCSYVRIGERNTQNGEFSFSPIVTQHEAVEELISKDSSTNITNLKIAMIGDSTYAITGGGSASHERINDYLTKLSGAEVSNFAIGGTTMANYRPSGNTWTYYDFVQLMTAKINGDMSEQLSETNLADKPAHVRNAVTALNNADLSTYDVLLINYGTNDFTGESPLEIADAPYDLRSVKGAMRTMIERIGTAYPNLHLVFNTPFWRCWNTTQDYVNDAFNRENAYNLKLGDYVTGIESTAREYGLPVMNHLYEDGWNKYNRSIYFDANDGVHFNIAGAKFVARKTFEFLCKQGFALGELSE